MARDYLGGSLVEASESSQRLFYALFDLVDDGLEALEATDPAIVRARSASNIDFLGHGLFTT